MHPPMQLSGLVRALLTGWPNTLFTCSVGLACTALAAALERYWRNVREIPVARSIANDVQVFTRHTLAEMRHRASNAPRGRFGQLLHKDFYVRAGRPDAEDAAARDVQRFLNVFAKGSYVMPHVHPEKGKWEFFVHTDGDFNVVAFDPSVAANDASNVVESARLSAELPLVFVTEGCWHSLAALDDGGGVEFEFKPGPYGGVSKDKQFSFQLGTPWAFEDGSAPPRYVEDLEAARGSRAASPGSPPAAHRLLRPFSRAELLAMLDSGRERERLSSSGPGSVRPVVTALAVPGAPHRQPVIPEVAAGDWLVFAWLAGGPVRVGQVVLGPDLPLIEVRGVALADVVAHGVTAATDVGGVVLELGAVSS